MAKPSTKLPSKKLKIIILSGGSGYTGEQVVRSALAQFDQPPVVVQKKGMVRTVDAARKVVRDAKKSGAVICNTLVAPDVRNAVAKEAHLLDVAMVDLLGPVVSLIGDHLQVAPHNQPGLGYELNREQFDRIDAVDFTLAHDDGQKVRDLDQADVVLVGISRVAKSVTCCYLAYLGIRAANVPVSPEMEVPEELLALPKEKVIALTMNRHRLKSVREARGKTWSGAMDRYSDNKTIAKELRFYEDLIAKNGWRSIDTSYKAIEDTAEDIMRMCSLMPD
jgi:[pyruvate, water dikinase]-phosphate phosphotransferase / [pyruvate, water dikinase] kinase